MYFRKHYNICRVKIIYYFTKRLEEINLKLLNHYMIIANLPSQITAAALYLSRIAG